jgi:hypothetical protein
MDIALLYQAAARRIDAVPRDSLLLTDERLLTPTKSRSATFARGSHMEVVPYALKIRNTVDVP